MPAPPTIELTSPAFARRLANLLVERRRRSGKSLRALARASGREFSVSDLQAIEAGRAELTEDQIGSVALLYQADLGAILPLRLPLEIRDCGVLSTSGLAAPFIPDDSTSVLTSYLRLVRQLRAQQREPVIELRRDDVEVLAGYLGEPGESIVDRLGALMGATMTQRRAMAGLFLAGALVIGITGGSVAALSSTGGGTPAGSPVTSSTRPAAVVEVTTTVGTEPVVTVTTPATTAPVATVPVSSAPVTTLPVTTAPATTAPATTTPATTAPVVTSTTIVVAPATTAPAGKKPPATVPTTAAPATTEPSAPVTTVAGPSPFDESVPLEAAPIDQPTTSIGVAVEIPPPTAAPTTTSTTIKQATDLPPVPSAPAASDQTPTTP